MVIDTSALVAMLNDEPEAQRFEIAVAADHVWLMSTASYPEMATVIETRFGEPGDVNPRSAASLSSIRVTISHVSIFARFSPAEPAMSALLDGVLDAHGGLQRWRAAETVHGPGTHGRAVASNLGAGQPLRGLPHHGACPTGPDGLGSVPA